jgi:purine nucleoside phosphorylase
MFGGLGCDVVGITVMPEAVLARELEMCYATVCFVSNMAAGNSATVNCSGSCDGGGREDACYSANLKRDHQLSTAET